MMATTDKLLPVTLPGWPTCDDCISWSEDDLAVASGDFVHILSPKSSASKSETAGHPQWRILSLRVNLFTQDEWPDQSLASINALSIGEEQSNSHAVSLAWSHAGLGLHRRSILAILTSNLILSLWETDGSHAPYQRTCLINKHVVQRTAGGQDDSERRAFRIRSFTWVRPLKTASTSKWGIHYLAIAHDDDTITILRISKADAGKLGNWNIKIELRCTLADLDPLETTTVATEHMSPLQQRLITQSPISKLDLSPWHDIRIPDNDQAAGHGQISHAEDSLLCDITVMKGKKIYTTRICSRVSKDGREASIELWKKSLDREYTIQDLEGYMPSNSMANTNLDQQSTERVARLDSQFKEVLKPIRDNFDTTFGLSGHLRTRFWGSAMSVDGTKVVACITLHPSDMIEYNIPSAERCTLVFRTTGRKQSILPSSLPKSAILVQKHVLAYVCDTLKDCPTIESPLDQKLLNAYRNLERTVLGSTSGQERSLLATQNGAQVDCETCEVCNDAILFTHDTEACSCNSGHRFSRCQLSFLAIQEPGISKYCSQCGKQFLDLKKLGASEGSSFAHAVFDEFDVCPYCQAKFRG